MAVAAGFLQPPCIREGEGVGENTLQDGILWHVKAS